MELGGKIQGSSELLKVLFLQFGANTYADGVIYSGGKQLNSEGGGLSSLFSVFPLSLLSGPDVEPAKAAAYDAVKRSQADFIVDPRYEISVKDFLIFQTISVKVNGVKGTVKGYRELK